eukprot:scaffold259550_cov33-Tisochrysis_lutea.AAC.4
MPPSIGSARLRPSQGQPPFCPVAMRQPWRPAPACTAGALPSRPCAAACQDGLAASGALRSVRARAHGPAATSAL